MATEVATNKIQLEIVTPRGRALHAVVDEVSVPSVQGEFGILPGHLPLLAATRTGIVSYREAGEQKRVAIGQGFAEAGPHKLLLLTDQYAERDQVDPVVVRKELAEVQEKILRADPEGDGPEPTKSGSDEIQVGVGSEVDLPAALRALIAEESWLAVQLELYGDAPPATMRPMENWGAKPVATEAIQYQDDADQS